MSYSQGLHDVSDTPPIFPGCASDCKLQYAGRDNVRYGYADSNQGYDGNDDAAHCDFNTVRNSDSEPNTNGSADWHSDARTRRSLSCAFQ